MRLHVALLALTACGRVDFAHTSADAGATSLCRNYQAARAPAFTTSSTGFTLVPGSELDVSVPAGETWMVWGSAALRSNATSAVTVEARLVIDGMARSTNGVQEEVADTPLPWFTFDLLAPGDHHVAVELRDAVDTGTIENLRVVAFRAPVVASAEMASERVIDTNTTDIVALTTPVPAGDYLVFGAMSMSEGPGTSGSYSTLRDPAGGTWPANEFSNHRAPYRSLAWVRRVTLPGGVAPFAITARSVSTSTVREARIALVAADPATTHYAEALPITAATTAGPRSVVTLDLPALAAPSDRVILQTMALKGADDLARSYPLIGELHIDGSATTHYEDHTVAPPVVPWGVVDAVTASAGMRLENILVAPDPASRMVTSREAVILALDLPCP